MAEEKKVKVQYDGPLDQRCDEVGFEAGTSALMEPGKVYEVSPELAHSLSLNANFKLYGEETRAAVEKIVKAEEKKAAEEFVAPLDANDMVKVDEDGRVVVKAVPRGRADELREYSQQRAKLLDKTTGGKAARKAAAEGQDVEGQAVEGQESNDDVLGADLVEGSGDTGAGSTAGGTLGGTSTGTGTGGNA